MLKYDLHSHSRYSKDGIMEVRDLLKIAKKRGLDGIAVTDHDTIRGGVEALKLKPEGIEVICGSEVHTDRGDVIGLYLTEEIKARKHTEVIEEIKAQGGVAIVPHPFDSMRRSAFWLTENDAPLVDGVEVMNARCVFRRYNDAADSYANAYGKAKVGGSDAHFGAEIGNACTLLEEGADLREAILHKKTVAFGRASSAVFHVRTTALLVQRKINRRRI